MKDLIFWGGVIFCMIVYVVVEAIIKEFTKPVKSDQPNMHGDGI